MNQQTRNLSFNFIFLMLISIGFSLQNSNSHVYPRPLIAEYSETNEFNQLEQQPEEEEESVAERCTSWRFAVETNNLRLWKTVPVECGEYVKDYINGRGYGFDLQRVFKEGEIYAKRVFEFGEKDEDGRMDAWIFDIDETLLSNLPYYSNHGYGLEVFDHVEFDKWVEKGEAPAIKSSFELYSTVTRLGYKVILLTGRSERHRNITVDNLVRSGFQHWDKLILRSAEDQNKKATAFKSEKRDELVKQGYRIVGSIGDQWSDLLGSSMANRSFKLPNPMYYIP